MKIYLASPFEKQAGMKTLADSLTHAGYTITSKWLTEDETAAQHAALAWRDVQDINEADVVVVNNPTDFFHAGTGGRHVEFGYALAMHKPLILLGRPSNVFHYLPTVIQAPDYHTLFTVLAGLRLYYTIGKD